MFDKNLSLSELYWRATVVAAAVLAPIVIYQSRMIVLSTLIGVGLAALISPVVAYFKERWGLNRFVGTMSILLFVGLLFGLAFVLMGSILVGQYESLKDSLPSVISSWEQKWQAFSSRYPRAEMLLEENQASGLASQVVPFLKSVIKGLTSFFTGLSLALVIALFTAANAKRYFRGFINLWPERLRETVSEDFQLSATILRKWFQAQLIDMVAVFVMTSIGLFLSGIEYWFIYGLLAGILSIVPFVGILVVVVFASAVVVVQQPDQIGYLLLVFIVTQQLEGNFILPKLMKDRVQTPAAPLIFLMIFAGAWFGPLGVFVTPPLVAISVGFIRKYVPGFSENSD